MDLNEKVGASVIAEALGLKSTRVNELVANGVLHPEGKPRKYVLKQAIHDYIEYIKGFNDPGRAEQQKIEKNKLKAEAALKAARATEAQMELAELSGKMHSSEDVKAAFEQLVYGVRSIMMALPGRLAMDVMSAANSAEAAEIIREQIDEGLNILAQFEYDPEFFAERVRDRKGWYGAVDDYARPESEKPKPRNRKHN